MSRYPPAPAPDTCWWEFIVGLCPVRAQGGGGIGAKSLKLQYSDWGGLWPAANWLQTASDSMAPAPLRMAVIIQWTHCSITCKFRTRQRLWQEWWIDRRPWCQLTRLSWKICHYTSVEVVVAAAAVWAAPVLQGRPYYQHCSYFKGK